MQTHLIPFCAYFSNLISLLLFLFFSIDESDPGSFHSLHVTCLNKSSYFNSETGRYKLIVCSSFCSECITSHSSVVAFGQVMCQRTHAQEKKNNNKNISAVIRSHTQRGQHKQETTHTHAYTGSFAGRLSRLRGSSRRVEAPLTILKRKLVIEQEVEIAEQNEPRLTCVSVHARTHT